MNRVIHKYQLSIADSQKIMLPEGSELLSIQTQPGHPDVPMLWVMHDDPSALGPDAAIRPYRVLMRGTGHPVPPTDDVKLRFISTMQIRGGTFVLHCFEVI